MQENRIFPTRMGVFIAAMLLALAPQSRAETTDCADGQWTAKPLPNGWRLKAIEPDIIFESYWRPVPLSESPSMGFVNDETGSVILFGADMSNVSGQTYIKAQTDLIAQDEKEPDEAQLKPYRNFLAGKVAIDFYYFSRMNSNLREMIVYVTTKCGGRTLSLIAPGDKAFDHDWNDFYTNAVSYQWQSAATK